MIREDYDLKNFFEFRLKLNTRLVNFLTAVKLYKDQQRQYVPNCVPNSRRKVIKDIVEEFFTKEREENKEFRFIDELRNYVQHRGLAVHWTQLCRTRKSIDDNFFLEYSMELASQRVYLEKDTGFNGEVLKEQDEKIDLKAATRNYVESIGNVHESIRNLIAQSVSSAREIIEEAHRKYLAVYSGRLIALSACEYSDKEQISAIPLLLDSDDIRLKFQERNKIINLKKRYVTSIIKNLDT